MATPKLKKVIINGIDVSSYITEFKVDIKYKNYISSATISLSSSVSNIITFSDESVGDSVTIQRGVNSATEKYIFRGEIRNINFDGINYVIECKDKLFEAIRTYVTYSFDKNNDPEAGKISEIFKTLINDYTSLTATSASIQDSGDDFVLNKFVCKTTPIYERLVDLAEAIDWQFYYNPEDDLVYFEPKGYTTGNITFTVGNNIPEVPKWTYNSDKLANKITVRGAEQLVETTEYFDGDGTNNQEIQLTKTPVSVKVYVGSGSFDPDGATPTRPSDNENNLKTGGKEDSTSGTYYYSYDEDSNIKKVFFGDGGTDQPSGVPPSGTNNIEVRYTYKLPVPVVSSNQTSINKYGLNEKIITKSDLKNVEDAEIYARNQLNKYSEVFATSNFAVLEEEEIFVGRVYDIIDNINGIDGEFIITRLTLNYPNTTGDVITVGDELWKTNEWNVEVWDRLKRLEEQQTESEDLLVDVREKVADVKLQKRYIEMQAFNNAGGAILGNVNFGILGTMTLSSDTSETLTILIIQGNNTYEEYIYDNDFFDEGNSTCTFDYTNRRIEF